MNQSRKLTDGALLTVIFIILMAIAIFVPGAILVLIFVLPLPFIIYAYRYDWQPSLIMFVAAILFALFFVSVVSLPLTVLTSIGGIMIGTATRRKLSAYETLGRGVLGYIAGLLFIYIFVVVFLGINLVHEIDVMMEESLEISQGIMKEFGFPEMNEKELEPITTRLSMVKDLIPVGIAMISIIMAFISQWLSYKFLNRLEKTQLYFPLFRNLRIPVAIIWVYFISLIIMFMDLDPNSSIYLVVNNVLSLVGLFIVLQGFSFLFFITYQKKWPKALPIIAVVITLMLPILFINLVRILGIIDIGFGIRDRYLKEKK